MKNVVKKIVYLKAYYPYVPWEEALIASENQYLVSKSVTAGVAQILWRGMQIKNPLITVEKSYSLKKQNDNSYKIFVDLAKVIIPLSSDEKKLICDFLNELHNPLADAFWTFAICDRLSYASEKNNNELKKVNKYLRSEFSKAAKSCGMTDELIDKFNRNFSVSRTVYWQFPLTKMHINFYVNLEDEDFRDQLLSVAENFAAKKAKVKQAFIHEASSQFLQVAGKQALSQFGHYYPVATCLAGFFSPNDAKALTLCNKEIATSANDAKEAMRKKVF